MGVCHSEKRDEGEKSMKKLFTNITPIYQIVALNIFGGIIINEILQSDVLTNSKISLSIIIGVIIALVIISIFHKSFKEQQEDMINQMDTQFEKYFVSLKELADQGDDVMEAHCKELEETVKRLENSMNTFPLAVAKEFTVYSIIRKGYQKFYDSDWVISGDFEGKLFACHITRTDEETVDGLITLIEKAESIDDIWTLDQYAEIYPEEQQAS